MWTGFIVKVHATAADFKAITVLDDYPTIQAVVGNITAGDKVFIKKGTYQEFVEIKKLLTLLDEDRSNTIIKAPVRIYGQFQSIIKIEA